MSDDRHGSLAKLVTSKDSILTLDTLLDAFKVLYEECSSPTLRTNKNVALFLERYGDTVKEIQRLRLSPSDFQSLQVIGRGEFGEVHLAKLKDRGDIYAMKLLNKVEICRQLEKTYYWEERDVMARNIDSPWIITLDYAFQDAKFLYLIMEFVPGGDLFTLMTKFDFEEDWVRFYLAQAVLAVNDMHKLGFCHRDIKPDNIMLDRDGNIKLADFGSTACLGDDGKIYSDTAVGTPDYVSPEVLDSQGGKGYYGKECDWWAVGIVAYEMMCGDPPFSSESLVGTYGNIMNHKSSLVFPDDIPLSEEAKSIVRGFLTDSSDRLGSNGIEEIKRHEFFQGFDWSSAANKTMAPPYIPELLSEVDTTHFEDILEKPVSKEEFTSQRGFSGNHLPFVGFSYTKAQQWGAHLMAGGGPLAGVVADVKHVTEPARSIKATPTQPSAAESVTSAVTDELEERISSHERRIELLNGELKDAEAMLQKAQKGESTAINQLHSRDMQLTELEARNKAITRKLDRATKQRADTLTKLEEKNLSLEREVEVTKTDSRKAEDRARRAEDKIECLQNQLVEAQDTAKAHEQMRNDEQSSVLDESLKSIETLKAEITALKDTLTSRDSEIQSLYQEKAELDKKTSLLSLNLEEMKQQLAVEAKNRETSDAKAKETDTRQREMSDTIAQLSAAAEETRTQVTESQNTHNKTLKTAKVAEAELNVTIESLRTQLGEAQREMIIAEELRKGLESELVSTIAEFAAFQSTKRAEAGAVSEQLEGSLAENREKINALTKLVSQLETQKATAQQDITTLTQKLETEKANRALAENKVNELSAAAATAQATQEAQLVRIKALQSDYSALKESTATLTTQLTIAHTTITNMGSEHDVILQHKNTLNKANAVLEIDLKETKRQNIAAAQDIQSLKTSLEESGEKIRAGEGIIKTNLAQAQAQAKEWQLKLETMKHTGDTQKTALLESYTTELANAEARAEELESEFLDVRLRMKDSERKADDYEHSYLEIKQELETVGEETDALKLQTARMQQQQRDTYNQLAEAKAAHAAEVADLREQLTAEFEEKELYQAQAFHTQEKLKMTVVKLQQSMVAQVATKGSTMSKQDWKEKREEKMHKQELKNFMRKYEEEVANNKTLQEENTSLTNQVQQMLMDIEDLNDRLVCAEDQMANVVDRATVKSFDRLSQVDIHIPRRITNTLNSRRAPMDMWARIPKSKKNLKKGWDTVFVRLNYHARELQVFSREPAELTTQSDQTQGLLMSVSLTDIKIARAPNRNEAHSVKSEFLAAMFYIIYYPPQQCTNQMDGRATIKSNISSNSEGGLGLHQATGHVLKEVLQTKPSWCTVCSERIWSLKEKQLKCTNVSMQKDECDCTIHSRCISLLKTHNMCSIATQAQQQFFLCKNVDVRSTWVGAILSESVKKKKPTSESDVHSYQSSSPSVRSMHSTSTEKRLPMREASSQP